ncbi:putative peroxin 26 [Phaeomoniella chlamydospora]|uniref:Putative peroxin 26 n=1 Tax=Phaeomoniella chlamydospora TaxID=158046 RepID=A0A0G2GNP3_PHACM|nr:putative peroxin 26 [Phaeomoniella chlamydospora]
MSAYDRVLIATGLLFHTEALSLLEPVVSPQIRSNGHSEDGEGPRLLAPIASASVSQRIKIWSLYIALLNSILDLTDEEGDHGIGSKRFKQLGSEVRDGHVWEAVVRDGYGGREGSVDSEVVYNLTTLLLGQASDQKSTQRRLETYLSASPDLDFSSHLQRSPSRKSRNNGTNTPRDLSSRVKIVELFTLHVLPRNDEWDYARSFIMNSDLLDEERREAFLQTLDELKDVEELEEPPNDDMIAEREEARKREYETQTQVNAVAGMRQVSDASVEQLSSHKRSTSEVDYGIDSPRHKSPPNGAINGGIQLPGQNPTRKILAPKSKPPPSSMSRARGRQAISPKSAKAAKAHSTGALPQARNMVRLLQNLAKNTIGNLTGNPAALLKMLIFILALLGVLGKAQVRERLQRTLGGSWAKLKGTVGMGMKVSYI